MLTSARPMLPTASGAPVPVVRLETAAPWPAPSANAETTSTASARNFAHVATPTIIAPTLAPLMLANAAKPIAAAERLLAMM